MVNAYYKNDFYFAIFLNFLFVIGIYQQLNNSGLKSSKETFMFIFAQT